MSRAKDMPRPDGAQPRAKRRSLRQFSTWARRRLRNRPDSEHEMTLNRLAFSFIVLAYLGIATLIGGEQARAMLVTTYPYFALYIGLSLALFAHILIHPGVSERRRYYAIVHDLTMISYAAQAGGAATGFFYPFYLWTIFGNGFRFGVPYLYAATAVSLVGFTAVLTLTSFWSHATGLAVALFAGLIILPLYVSVLIRKLSEAKRQAEEASRAKSLFLASVSHELRTPLNAIIGLSDLLKSERLDRELAGMVRVIGTSGRSLLTLINSILDFSRTEAGRMPSKITEFDLYAAIGQIRAMLAVQAQAKSLRLAMHISARTPRLVSADLQQLEEVLVNIAGNAVKFTTSGHVVIAVDTVRRMGDTARLRFEVSDTGIGIAPEAHARIFDSFTQADETIIDRFGGTGLGLAIAKQFVERQRGEIGLVSALGEGSTFWFEIDAKVCEAEDDAPVLAVPIIILSDDAELVEVVGELASTVRVATSADQVRADIAALAVEGAYPVVAMIDARAARNCDEDGLTDALGDCSPATPLIAVVEDAGAGMPSTPLRSRYASLVGRPLDSEALAAALRIAAASAGAGEEIDAAPMAVMERRPFCVLVAEDNRTNQMVIGKILERAGHTVSIADNGEMALDKLRDGSFDIVLMDVNMPTMNGIEATKLYRFASLGRPRIPIIGLTADATEEGRARCEEAGMDACATKPIEPQRLLDIIEAAVPHEPLRAQPVGHGDGVVRIGEHHGLRSPSGVINAATLQDLERLGGRDFVAQLVTQFASDAAALIAALHQTVTDGNAHAFREQAHALRSCAANVGAQSIFEMCLAWRQITPHELAANGEEHMKLLAAEFETVTSMLDTHLADKEPTAMAAAGRRLGGDVSAR